MKPITNVIIVGASSAGLLSAVTLKHYFPQLDILLLHSDRYEPIAVGESTTAWIPQFLHDCLAIHPTEFYQEVTPIWKLGIRFEWGNSEKSHFNYTFDRQFTDESVSLSKPTGVFCMHDLEKASRFSILMDKGHAPMWVSAQNKITAIPDGFGYHLEIEKFCGFLWQKAQGLGVRIQELEILDAEVDEVGNLQSLICANGEKIQADLFVDASGFQSKLLGKQLQEKFVSYSHRLFCDRALVGSRPRHEPILPYTTVTTFNSGWRWRIDLPDKISFGYVYSSEFCSQEEAQQEYLQKTPKATDHLREISFKSGRYERFWVNNVIAVGNASGFVEPLESTGQHMIAETIWRVVLALQDSNLCPQPQLIATTNQYIADLWDEICDFLTLHFKFNRRLNTPFWQHCQEKTDLGKIQSIVDLYQESGVCRALSHLVPHPSVFQVDGYLSLLCGQGLLVKHQPALTSEEYQEWENYRQQLDQNLKTSLTPEQALEVLKDAISEKHGATNSG